MINTEHTASQIVLIGMPASGKSTLGLLLAKSVCRDFIDTDILMQKREHATLQHLLDKHGMAWFIEHESAAVLSLDTNMPACIIATGGSVVLSEPAMQHLQRLGHIVFIDAPLDRIAARMRNIHTRGIAREPGQSLEDVYRLRLPLYRAYADSILDAGDSSVEELVEQLTDQFGLESC